MTALPSRPAYLEVNTSQLRRNLENIRRHVHPAKVMILLKANAYGHGIDGVAEAMAPFADYMGVAIAEEGLQLRALGITTPTIVLGGILPEELPRFIPNNLTASVSSMELLQAAERAAAAADSRMKVHLNLDTGMERTGVHDYEAESFLEKSLECTHLEIEGIYTHFANSEAADLQHARLQISRFQEALAFYDRKGIPRPPLRHAANSGAILQLPECHYEMVRAGLMFYGVYPRADIKRTVEVRPALTWKARVVHSKLTQPGRPVSYGSTWTPDRPVRIITVPVGYGDGYFRRMSNVAQVIVNDRLHPQVGRICMDQFMVNMQDEDVGTGEEVILLGGNCEGTRVSVEDMAAWAGTSEYEIMTNIGARVPRRFVTDDG